METKNVTALLIAVTVIVGAIIYLDQGKVSVGPDDESDVVSIPLSPLTVTSPEFANSSEGEIQPMFATIEEKKARFERAKEITSPDGFINTSTGSVQAPITIGELVGKKVILLDIWTYSCINCQRTFPYLRAWHEKYADKGLVIIGLHTPEFEFEKVYENVLSAVKKFEIKYPVVLDNDFSTWRAYRNQYWPRKYLIDIDGFVVYDHIGEGGYEETERRIQEALEERAERLGENDSINTVPLTKEQPPTSRPGSPETYFGAFRNENFGNGTRGKIGEQTLTLSDSPRPNTLYLGGKWDIQKEYAENKEAGGVIEFRYKAKDVYFVASSKDGVNLKIYKDGELMHGEGSVDCSLHGFCGGEDVLPDGTVYVRDDRLYRLIQNGDVEEHVLRIEAEGPGLKAFTFTFG